MKRNVCRAGFAQVGVALGLWTAVALSGLTAGPVHVADIAGDSRPVVVVLAPFRWKSINVWSEALPVRDQVAGELTRNYNCVVLSRAFGHALSVEDAVKRLGAIDDADFAPEELAGADYCVTGMFDPDHKAFVLRMVDLRSASEQLEDKVTSVSIPAIRTSAPQIAKGIAEAATIPKRSSPRTLDNEHRVWMVLPPVVTAPPLQGKKLDETAAALQMAAETALQKDGRVKLVDRTAIEAVLKELAIGALRNEADLKKVSRLVGADRALIALASGTGKKNEVQVDVLALDVARTEALGASVRRCGKDDVRKAVEEGVAECMAVLGVPGALSPATPAQRFKEALLGIDTIKQHFERYRAQEAPLIVMAHAEMVYLLARDSREIMYDISKFVATQNWKWGTIRTEHRVLVKGEGSQFIRRVLAQYPDMGEQDDGSWMYNAAQSFSADKDGASARRFAEKALQAKPLEYQKPILRRVLAECYYAQGDYKSALDCTKNDLDYGTTRLARVKICHAMQDEDAEFAAMSAMSSNDYFDYNYYFENFFEGKSSLWFRHVELLEKREGPAAVCAFIEKDFRTVRGFVRDHLRYELAKYYARAGNKQKAAEIGQLLLEQGRWGGWIMKDADFRKLLEALMAQVGDVGNLPAWLKACEVKAIPDEYAFYIQPVGNVRPQLLEAVRSGVETFFGVKTVVLPAFELSYDKPYYMKETNRYNARLLTEEVRRQITLPSNALSAAMVIDEVLHSPEAKTASWHYVYAHFVIIASTKSWAYKDQEQAIRNLIISDISRFSFGVGYGEVPCITSRMKSSEEIHNAKFAYSPQMQEMYRNVDFAEKNRALVNYFRDSGATIVAPESRK